MHLAANGRLSFSIVFLGLFIAATYPVLAWPQASAAGIAGRVTDASGAIVGEATISVTNLETGARRLVTTDGGGEYRVLALSPGLHEVRGEKTGFKAAVRSGIRISVGQEAVVNLRLELGEHAEVVRVSEEIPLVNTTASSVAGLVEERQVKDLPLNGRSYDNLITLNPGAVNYSSMKSPQTVTSNGNSFSVAGRRPSENLFLLNGVEYTGTSQLAVTPGGASGVLLGIDAVREFNVVSDAYGAEYGKRAGAQISIVTQSGSNDVHGSLFEFVRNSALDARNFFDYGSVAPFKRNQFGGALGGPIRKNRAFLFGSYEGFRQRLGISNVSVVPDEMARKGLLPDASGVPTPVPNLNPKMLAYMAFWPLPNGSPLLANGVPGGTALSYSNPRQSVREEFGTLRADISASVRDSISASYTLDDGKNVTPLADPLFTSHLTLRSQVASLQHTHVFSSRVLNIFRAGFSRAGFGFGSGAVASFPADLSFVAGSGPGGIVIGGGVTTTGVAAITAAGPSNAANVWNRRNLFTYTDGLHISAGIHQISIGIWFQRLQSNDNAASRTLGQATFSGLQTFLQGTASTFNVVANPTEVGWRSFFGAWYAQDAIRLRPDLTVQLGLRHEFTTGWNEVSGRGANYIVDASGVLQTDSRVADSVFTENNAQRLFGPRIGLAWDVAGNGKTAIHAGFGTYYNLMDALSFQLNAIPPYNGTISFQNVPLHSIMPIVRGAPVPPACGPSMPAPCTIYSPQGIQADAKTPTVQEWNLSVERQIGSNRSLRIAYVGSFGYHNLLSIDPNTIAERTCSNANGCVAGGVGTARGNVVQGARYIPVGTRPNPYLSGGFFWYSEGNSSYNAFQAETRQRLNRGLQWRANYTWSKNLDMNSGLTGAQSVNQAQMVMDRNNLRRDWGPSALNPEHQSSLSVSYDLPLSYGKAGLGHTGAAGDRWIRGWQLNGIVTLLSGFPFTPQIGSNRSGDGDVRNPDRPSVNPNFGGPVLLRHPTRWFDPNAFVLPTAGTYGNLGRGTLTGPGLAEVDLSLLKSTAISEKVRLQLRAECFNLFNHTNLGAPNPIVFSSGTINPSAGLITSTATTSRQIQVGIKLIF